MIVPTIHLNGTSQKELLKQLMNVMRACDDAEAALGAASPHGRDYYPQGGNVINQAIAEHNTRIERIRSVHKEMEEIAEAIVDQVNNPQPMKASGNEIDWIKPTTEQQS